MNEQKEKTSKNTIDKELRFRGKLIKIAMPNFCTSWAKFANSVLSVFYKGRKRSRNLSYEQMYVSTASNEKLRLCVYKRKNATNALKPLVFWLHGGGYGIGVPEIEVTFIKEFLSVSDCVVISPDYTRSVDAKYPQALLDCYESLLWVKNNCEKFNIDNSQIFIGGDSAGGGLCLALSLYARDKGGVKIAYQMPLYPMIDNRETSTNQNNDMPVWNSKSNENAWRIYLGENLSNDDVSCYAVPALATDFSNLPTTLTYVGDVEPFFAETREMINNLQNFGVKTFFKVYKGCYHGFDVVCPNSKAAKDAREFLRNGFKYALKNCFKAQD